jgi:hypothetical protein
MQLETALPDAATVVNTFRAPRVGESLECVTAGPIVEASGTSPATYGLASALFRVTALSSTEVTVELTNASGARLVHGDSGGACYLARDGKRTLVGLVSYAFHDDAGRAIERLTRIDAFGDFLRSRTGAGASVREAGPKIVDFDGNGVTDHFLATTKGSFDPDGRLRVGSWRTRTPPFAEATVPCEGRKLGATCVTEFAALVDAVPAAFRSHEWRAVAVGPLASRGLAVGASRSKTDLLLYDATNQRLAIAKADPNLETGGVATATLIRVPYALDAENADAPFLAPANDATICGSGFGPVPVATGVLDGRPALGFEGPSVGWAGRRNVCLVVLRGATVAATYRDFVQGGLDPDESLRAVTDFDRDGFLEFAFESRVRVRDSASAALVDLTRDGKPVYRACFRSFGRDGNWRSVADPLTTGDLRCTTLAPGQRFVGAADLDLDGRAEVLLRDPPAAASAWPPVAPKIPVGLSSPSLAGWPEPFGSADLTAERPSSFAVRALTATPTAGGIFGAPTVALLLPPQLVDNRSFRGNCIRGYRVRRGVRADTLAIDSTLDDGRSGTTVPHPYLYACPQGSTGNVVAP